MITSYYLIRGLQTLPCKRCAGKLLRRPSICTRYTTSLPQSGYETPKPTIVDSFPLSWQPYLRLIRLDRPIGYYLLFWPCAWSIGLAAEPGELPNMVTMTTFAIGSFIMRGAGCTINDLWDKNYDSKVFRTSSRPLASGQVTSLQGLIFLGGQLLIGLSILLSLNYYSIILGAMSLPLVIVYPLMKRYTFWPQFILGLTINWGALLGYAAVKGYCDWSVCLPLYIACVSWTLLYDTIYAYQDVFDDKKLGLRSTALKFGNQAKPWLSLFAAVMSSSLLIVGLNGGLSWPYFAGVGVVSTHLAWQISSVNLSDPVDCLKTFKSNNYIGIVLILAIIAGFLRES